MWITLTNEEYLFAVKIGKLRQQESKKRKLIDKHGLSKEKGEDIHIIGAAGELAAAKALGLKWEASVNTFKKISDLDSNIEVRTRTKPNYDLIIRHDDKDDRKYVLVYQKDNFNYEVVGWILGLDAKREQWIKRYGGRSPAYFVPRSNLITDFSQKTYSQLAGISLSLLKNSFKSLGFNVKESVNLNKKIITLLVSKDNSSINFIIDFQTGEVIINEHRNQK